MAMQAFPIKSDWVKARLYHLLAPLVALAVVAVFEQTWLGEFLEDQAVNLRFRVRSAFDHPADPRLVFVGIDRQSLEKYGRYPWKRTVLADFLTNLAKAKMNPHGVTFDILYTEKSLDPADDIALGDATGLLPGVTTGAISIDPSEKDNPETLKEEEEQTRAGLKDPGPTAAFNQIHGDRRKIRGSNIASFPVDPIRQQSLFGFVNDEPSTVDYIRHVIPLVIRVDDQIYPSLALQTLCQMLDVDADKVEVNVGKNVVLRNSSHKRWTIPINERGEYTINYRRDSSFTNNLSFRQFSEALEKFVKSGRNLDPAFDVQKKTLLIGETEVGLTDLGPTPIDAQSPLPYTHLNVINNVLKGDYLTFVPEYWVVIGWLAITWITLLRLKVAPLAEAVLAPIAVVVLFTVIAFGIFGLWSIQIDLAWPALSYSAVTFWAVVLRWQEERQGREQIKRVFSQMLSTEVMGHLLDHSDNLKLGGSKRAVTILFSDIRDYTGFSEGLEEEELVRQLNVYFTRMVACINECRGTLHKFIGDAIMCVWGDIAAASQSAEKDAQSAVRSALLMRRRLRELNAERSAASLPPIRIGMGLNHGEVLVGLIGATNRSEFTVMGDAVNVASRLEGITKEFHTDLAISESVRKLIGDDFLVRRLGFIQLKGKTKATVVYEVLAEKTDLAQSKMTQDMVAVYEKAFDDFLAQRFDEAEEGFMLCRQSCPGDYCVNQYLTACRDYADEPPPADWDGRIVMTSK